MKDVYLAYESEGLCTEQLQELIDRCAANGGGQVRLTAGIYRTATLYLKSHVELFLDAGVVLRGSDHCQDYSNRCPHLRILPEIPKWYDSLITAVNEHDIRISGEGMIDGVDCLNPDGEQGFRGPHAIFFYGCKDILLQGISIVRSACYNLMFERCENITVTDIKLRGGQDGFRFGDCSHAIIDRCDIRTGDDCIGGSGNRDVQILNSMLNTPGGSTIMFSCVGLLVRNCRFWGTGYYPAVFSKDKRYSLNMVALMIGYDYGYDGHEPSDDWVIEDSVFENVRCLLRTERELYDKKCIPIRKIRFDRIRAFNLADPISIKGNGETDLNITDSHFHFTTADPEYLGGFLHADGFQSVSLKHVSLEGCTEKVIQCQNGQSVHISDVSVQKPVTSEDLSVDAVQTAFVEYTEPETLYTRYVEDGITSLYIDKNATEEFRGPMAYIRSACESADILDPTSKSGD